MEGTDCSLPVEVEGAETIARLFVSPFHIKKNKPIPTAFRPTDTTDEVSVIRLTHMGKEFCDAKGLELELAKPKELSPKYQGFGSAKVNDVRGLGHEVFDSRIQYCGHGHISIGIVLSKAEPLPSEEMARLHDICKKLRDLFGFEKK